MSNYGFAGHGFSLKALLENPELQTAPSINCGNFNVKKPGLKNGGNPMPNVNSAFLGSNLWDKPNGEDGFDLEYMDLDEFLSENGIPVNLEENDESETISLLASALAKTPPRSPNDSNDLAIGPVSPSIDPIARISGKEKVNESVDLGVYIPDSPGCQQTVSPLSLSPQPSAIEKCLMDDNFGIKTIVRSAAVRSHTGSSNTVTSIKRKLDLDDDLADTDTANSLVAIPVYSQNNTPSVRASDYLSPPLDDEWNVSEESYGSNYCDDDNNDTLETQSSLPGQENFDPTSRKFSEEELKPQPIIKKSRKQFVDDSAKDDRYWQRRKKNNVAAKRSRDARRVKENQIAMRASYLESQNDQLKIEFDKIKKENEELIKRLSKYEKV